MPEDDPDLPSNPLTAARTLSLAPSFVEQVQIDHELLFLAFTPAVGHPVTMAMDWLATRAPERAPDRTSLAAFWPPDRPVAEQPAAWVTALLLAEFGATRSTNWDAPDDPAMDELIAAGGRPPWHVRYSQARFEDWLATYQDVPAPSHAVVGSRPLLGDQRILWCPDRPLARQAFGLFDWTEPVSLQVGGPVESVPTPVATTDRAAAFAYTYLCRALGGDSDPALAAAGDCAVDPRTIEAALETIAWTAPPEEPAPTE